MKFLLNGITKGSNGDPSFGILYDFRIIPFSWSLVISSLRLIPLSFKTFIYLENSSSLFSSCRISKILIKSSSFGINLYLSRSVTSSSNVNVKFKAVQGKCLTHFIFCCNYSITLSRWNQLHKVLRTPPLRLLFY